jgi:hypothetical protein
MLRQSNGIRNRLFPSKGQGGLRIEACFNFEADLVARAYIAAAMALNDRRGAKAIIDSPNLWRERRNHANMANSEGFRVSKSRSKSVRGRRMALPRPIKQVPASGASNLSGTVASIGAKPADVNSV